ncbi:hypothetical protein M408DRAFT_29511 [Serendipita vermifera MAFF 305830]|uniref:Uncharacterized protein n=1 Tax=Serendipita vermifera MAFF 305830 TaxID=933852 RepID=A0A0C3AQE4_SERVB|nr:hypothetical protein M408DRAFT_29511 [Serendipita vermifera MAFF 305830]
MTTCLALQILSSLAYSPSVHNTNLAVNVPTCSKEELVHKQDADTMFAYAEATINPRDMKFGVDIL